MSVILPNLAGFFAVALMIPAMMVSLLHSVAQPPMILRVFALVGIAFFGTYFITIGLWQIALVGISNIIFFNVAMMSRAVNQHTRLRLTYYLTLPLWAAMMLGWWLAAQHVASPLTDGLTTLIFAEGVAVATGILAVGMSWVPSALYRRTTLLSLGVLSSGVLLYVCAVSAAWFGVVLYALMLGVLVVHHLRQHRQVSQW